MSLRGEDAGIILNEKVLEESGLTETHLRNAILELNELVDALDTALVDHHVQRLSRMVELANLSSMLGNIFAAAVAQHSNEIFVRNGPHKYPDLLSKNDRYDDIEIKVALETNKPKGHLIKIGRYLTCRYVLCDEEGNAKFDKTDRGVIPWIWEVRCGVLGEEHFSVSNTEGDSGKTAVVNAEGMLELKIVYLDVEKMPYSEKSRIRKELLALAESS